MAAGADGARQYQRTARPTCRVFITVHRDSARVCVYVCSGGVCVCVGRGGGGAKDMQAFLLERASVCARTALGQACAPCSATERTQRFLCSPGVLLLLLLLLWWAPSV